MNVQDQSRFEAMAGFPGLVPGYMSGFGNSFETEALAGALPVGRNSPQKVSFGLYAEQLSGSPFTAPQSTNQRSWLYRIRPTVKHSGRYRCVDKSFIRTAPQARTESEPARAYVCENYGGAFTLPDRGPIGANCLANARDFMTPVAAFEDKEVPSTLLVKWGGELYATEIDQSPLDVVAWHGNYAPYKYDLRRFSPVGALLFDHPDPSIFTVMTAPSETPGTANVDFVIFPERWQVAENTFRPPWYHRNLMSEFMGLVYGVYDAKPEGFVPGGISLHNCMLPHGPAETAFEHASNSELQPVKLSATMAFMFETRFRQRITQHAAELPTRQDDYVDCWKGLKKHFNRKQRKPK